MTQTVIQKLSVNSRVPININHMKGLQRRFKACRCMEGINGMSALCVCVCVWGGEGVGVGGYVGDVGD